MDIIDTPLGSNPSYIWRSLTWNRDILHEGILWKIGNGEIINARKNAWIFSLPSVRITSHMSFDSNVSINNLLNNQSAWDVNKLSSLPFEVEAIKRVPIAGTIQPDTRYWRFKKKGSYFVKMGYWKTKPSYRSPMLNLPEASSFSKDPFWDKI